MKKCKFCEHWVQDKEPKTAQGKYGWCRCPEMSYDCGDYVQYRGVSLGTSEDFGCIFFRSRAFSKKGLTQEEEQFISGAPN